MEIALWDATWAAHVMLLISNIVRDHWPSRRPIGKIWVFLSEPAVFWMKSSLQAFASSCEFESTSYHRDLFFWRDRSSQHIKRLVGTSHVIVHRLADEVPDVRNAQLFFHFMCRIEAVTRDLRIAVVPLTHLDGWWLQNIWTHQTQSLIGQLETLFGVAICPFPLPWSDMDWMMECVNPLDCQFVIVGHGSHAIDQAKDCLRFVRLETNSSIYLKVCALVEEDARAMIDAIARNRGLAESLNIKGFARIKFCDSFQVLAWQVPFTSLHTYVSRDSWEVPGRFRDSGYWKGKGKGYPKGRGKGIGQRLLREVELDGEVVCLNSRPMCEAAFIVQFDF